MPLGANGGWYLCGVARTSAVNEPVRFTSSFIIAGRNEAANLN